MTTDPPATTSVRDAILARCDEIDDADRDVSGYPSVFPEWDDVTAGAREISKVHQPADDPDYHQPGCRGCGMDRTGEWMERIGDCPTLAALARMLGVEANR